MSNFQVNPFNKPNQVEVSTGLNRSRAVDPGSNGDVFTIVNGQPGWAGAPGGVNFSAQGQLVYGTGAGSSDFLTIGSAGQVLQSDGSDPVWASLTTTSGDLIFGNILTGRPDRLAIGDPTGVLYSNGFTPAWGAQGTNGQWLSLSSGIPTWADVTSAEGDLVVGDASGNVTQLAHGAAGTMLYSDGTTPAYTAAGSTGQYMVLSGTTPTWTTVVPGSGAAVPTGTQYDVVTVNSGATALVANAARAIMASPSYATANVTADQSALIAVGQAGTGTGTLSASQTTAVASQFGQAGAVTLSGAQSFLAAGSIFAPGGGASATATFASSVAGAVALRFDGGGSGVAYTLALNTGNVHFLGGVDLDEASLAVTGSTVGLCGVRIIGNSTTTTLNGTCMFLGGSNINSLAAFTTTAANNFGCVAAGIAAITVNITGDEVSLSGVQAVSGGALTVSGNRVLIGGSLVNGTFSLSGDRSSVIASEGGANITANNTAIVACSGNNAVTHAQSAVMCSTARSSTGANRLHVDNITSGTALVVSDKSQKAFVRDDAFEAEDAEALCPRFCSVKTKRYRLKKTGRELRGFDADEMAIPFPDVVESTYHQTYIVVRKSVLDPWTHIDRTSENEDPDAVPVLDQPVFTQGEVEEDDDDELTGYFYREKPSTVKHINMMALCNVLWAMCKKQQMLIESMQTAMAAQADRISALEGK